MNDGKLIVKRKATTAPAPPQRSVAPRQQAAKPADTLPEAPEVERAVLGAIFNEPEAGFATFESVARKGFFADPVNRELYDLGKSFFRENGRIDLIAFTAHLGDSGRLPALGGPARVTDIFVQNDMKLGVEWLTYYVDELRERYIRRQLIVRSFALAKRARTEDVSELLAELNSSIEDLKRAAGGPNGSERFAFKDLMEFDAKRDPLCLVGRRYLVKGGSSLWAGGSGYGKSSLTMQLGVYWACGTPCFGLRPVHPLKSLMIQAENDRGDMSEQLQGVMKGIETVGEIDIERSRELIENNIGIHRVVGKSGPEFLELLDKLIELDRPDICWIDPLFAFAGCDLTNAKDTSRFVRDGLLSIAAKRLVAINVIHHARKPSSTDGDHPISDIDMQYLGFGTSDIQNAFRAVNILAPVPGTGSYKLVLSKRGDRAGAKDLSGQWTRTVYLEHSKEGICWLQSDEPEAPTKPGVQKFTAKDVLDEMSIIHPIKTKTLQRKLHDDRNMSRATFFRIFAELQKDRRVVQSEDGWIRKSPTELL